MNSLPPILRRQILNASPDASRRRRIAIQFGMDGLSGPAERACGGFEECRHCRELLSSALVVAYKVHLDGQPSEEIAIDGHRVITCMKSSCVNRTRQWLCRKLAVTHVWLGNPIETNRVIMENERLKIAATTISSPVSPIDHQPFRRN